jgi:hypothetical protein
VRSFFFFGILLATVSLFARENPFKTTHKENIAQAAMDNINTVEKLQTISVTPPVDSVKIKKITIEYQSVDGARVKKVYDIEKGIDPLKTIKVSQ